MVRRGPPQWLRRQIDRELYVSGIHSDALHDNLQRGAKALYKRTYGTVSVDGLQHPYFWYEDDPNTLIFDDDLGYPCFALVIQPAYAWGPSEKGTAALIYLAYTSSQISPAFNVEEEEEWSLEPDAATTAAGKAVIAVAKERGITRIEFTDDLSIRYRDGRKFLLSEISILTTGATWMETVLQTPVRPANEVFARVFPRWRQAMMATSWDSVLSHLTRFYPDIIAPISTSDIDTNAPGSAMIVLQRIKESAPEFFVTYHTHLSACCNICNLLGVSWYVILS